MPRSNILSAEYGVIEWSTRRPCSGPTCRFFFNRFMYATAVLETAGDELRVRLLCTDCVRKEPAVWKRLNATKKKHIKTGHVVSGTKEREYNNLIIHARKLEAEDVERLGDHDESDCRVCRKHEERLYKTWAAEVCFGCENGDCKNCSHHRDGCDCTEGRHCCCDIR